MSDVVFTDYAPQASLQEMARRLGSPLAAIRLEHEADERQHSLAGQTIQLSEERFVVYLPPTCPERACGVVVFVPPWQDARIPLGWQNVLDRLGFIFVSAARSGNQENAFARRIPLALQAVHNIVRLYNVDAKRLYVAGFSGGSRLAMRLALAYPDLFTGALLDAGSDPIGNSVVPLPSRDLLYTFQTSSRIVYASGAQDPDRVAEDQVSMHSMQHWCMTNLHSFRQPLLAHEVLPAPAFARALESLLHRSAPDATRLQACRAHIEWELESRIGRARKLKADGNQKALAQEIQDLNDRFGGLAAPVIEELMSPEHRQGQ